MLNIKNLYYNIQSGISNLIYWGPTIWKDQQWDYYFIYKILNKKLSRMEKFFNSENAICEGKEYIADQCKQSIEILNNLEEEDYGKLTFKEEREKDLDNFFNIIKNNILNWWD